MSRVFVPQIPSRFDKGINSWVPSVNLNAAKKYGELHVMLPPEAGRLETDKIVELLKTAMADYGEEDFILALGDPMIIAIAAAIADRATSPLRILRWDKMERDYQMLEAKLDDKEETES